MVLNNGNKYAISFTHYSNKKICRFKIWCGCFDFWVGVVHIHIYYIHTNTITIFSQSHGLWNPNRNTHKTQQKHIPTYRFSANHKSCDRTACHRTAAAVMSHVHTWRLRRPKSAQFIRNRSFSKNALHLTIATVISISICHYATITRQQRTTTLLQLSASLRIIELSLVRPTSHLCAHKMQ